MGSRLSCLFPFQLTPSDIQEALIEEEPTACVVIEEYREWPFDVIKETMDQIHEMYEDDEPIEVYSELANAFDIKMLHTPASASHNERLILYCASCRVPVKRTFTKHMVITNTKSASKII